MCGTIPGLRLQERSSTISGCSEARSGDERVGSWFDWGAGEGNGGENIPLELKVYFLISSQRHITEPSVSLMYIE